MALIISAAAATPSVAVPTAYYNPATGHIRIVNDFDFRPLTALWMISDSGTQFVTDRSAYAAPPPGATLDLEDLPLGFTYLNFPRGNFAIGNIVVPGTPPSDLEFNWYYFEFRDEPGLLVTVPEPTSAACLPAVALIYFAAARRRRKAT